MLPVILVRCEFSLSSTAFRLLLGTAASEYVVGSAATAKNPVMSQDSVNIFGHV